MRAVLSLLMFSLMASAETCPSSQDGIGNRDVEYALGVFKNLFEYQKSFKEVDWKPVERALSRGYTVRYGPRKVEKHGLRPFQILWGLFRNRKLDITFSVTAESSPKILISTSGTQSITIPVARSPAPIQDHVFTCFPGKGDVLQPYSKTQKELTDCQASCAADPKCNGFDWTKNVQNDQCRFFAAGTSIITSTTGDDFRQYCLKKPYYCFSGQGPQGQTVANKQVNNIDECFLWANSTKNVVAFDFTTNQGPQNCRAYKAGLFRHDDGPDDRKYCLIGIFAPTQVFDKGPCIAVGRYKTLEHCMDEFDVPSTCTGGCAIDGSTTPRNYMCMEHQDEPVGVGSQNFHGICIGTPSVKSSFLCSVVDDACDMLMDEIGGAISDELECTEAAAEIAGICEVVGGGPEDPIADACAVILGVGFEVACTEAINEGVKFAGDQCKAIAGC